MLQPPGANNQDKLSVDLEFADPLQDPQTADPQTADAQGPDPAPVPAIQIDNDADKAALTENVRRMLDAAISARGPLNEKVSRWRKYAKLERRTVTPWEGAPNVTTPVVRQKIDGVEAHLISAIDLDPLFIAKPYSMEAQAHQIDLESVMEYEIDRNNSRIDIFASVQDAVITGTGHVKHVVYDNGDGTYTVADRYVRFENLYVYPVATQNRYQVSYFERYYIPFWEMKQQAEMGIYDPDMVESMKPAGSRTWIGDEDEQMRESMSDVVDDDNRFHEVWTCYIRWKGQMWVVEWSRQQNILLAAKPYAWERWFNYAPYQPVYIKPSPGFYYGDCIPEALDSLQEVADAAFNNELASAQFKMQPITFVRRGSVIAKKLKATGMVPAGIYEVDGPFEENIRVQEFAPGQFNYQLINFVQQMAEDATFSDMQIPGNATPGRKTATEVRVMQTIGSMKLRLYLSNVQKSLSQYANDKWRLIYEYIIKPAGIYQVFSGSDVSMVATRDTTLPDPLTGEMRNIPSGQRQDIQWVVKGGDTIPDKEARMSKFTELAQMFPLIQQAKADRSMWYIVQELLQTMDVYQWKQIIGPEAPPPAPAPQPQMLQQALANEQAGRSTAAAISAANKQ